MYHHSPNLVLGFHGCTKKVFKKILFHHEELEFSNNSYDWLGNGIYFWENSYDRAMDWAKGHCKDEEPAVIGTVLDLGFCLDLMDYASMQVLKNGYDLLKEESRIFNTELPVNRNIGKNTDLLIRELDCAVIERIHLYNHMVDGNDKYDSVRGAFIEGKPVYPGSGFRDRTHIQICVRNPNCIKGYFAPKIENENYSSV